MQLFPSVSFAFIFNITVKAPDTWWTEFNITNMAVGVSEKNTQLEEEYDWQLFDCNYLTVTVCNFQISTEISAWQFVTYQ